MNFSDFFSDIDNIESDELTISKNNLLNVLKKHSSTVSVFDLMDVSCEMIEDSKFVQKSYREKSKGIYAKHFLARLKYVSNDNNNYMKSIDKEEFIDAVSTLKSYHETESINTKTKFPLIYAIISLYTTFILEEPIHPVGTPFPGSLEVEEHDGIYYCPVKDANIDSPNAVCKMCIAEQLDF